MRRRSVAGWKWVYIVSGRDRIEHERRGGKGNMVWKTLTCGLKTVILN